MFNVEPAGGGGYSPVEYVWNNVDGMHTYQGGGKALRVGAKHVIMACWNRVTAHVVQDLSLEQVQGLCYARKPLIYGRVGLNNWRAFADSKVASVAPRGTTLFWDSFSVSAGAGFGPNATPGKYYGPTPNQPPEAPAQLTFTVVPDHPDAIPQLFAYSTGQQMRREMNWEDLEDSVID